MEVTAKMRCIRKAEQDYGHGKVSAVEVTFNAVYSSDPKDPNYSYSQATPSGEIKLQITNPAAYEAFQTGKQYLITFTPAD